MLMLEEAEMNYTEAMRYIEELSGYGIVPGLDSITELCRRLGNPQDSLKFVHVAGTNGKGSTASFVDSVMRTAGYKVGKYSSPAVFDYRERFQVNGRNITQVALCSYLERVKECAEAMMEEGLPHPTTFEVETALAFLYFADKECDLVVLETGMGGRLDATNVISNTLVAVLTSISMDHMAFLGKSIDQIAAEKAGIIKSKCYVISTKQEKDAERMIRQKASLQGARLVIADAGRCKQVKYGLKKQNFSYDGIKNIQITLSGNYQIENAVLAIEVVRALKKCGFVISEEQLKEGLLTTSWPGRFQMIGKKPIFIIDGAHNENAALRLKESIETDLSDAQKENIILIMGVFKDKEYEKVAKLICPFGKQIITVTPPEKPRGLSAIELAKIVQDINPAVTTADSIEEAVEMSYLLSNDESVILAFGSLSFLGRLSKLVENKTKK